MIKKENKEFTYYLIILGIFLVFVFAVIAGALMITGLTINLEV